MSGGPIFLIGQIASGKTTLAKRLLASREALWIPIESLPGSLRTGGATVLARHLAAVSARQGLIFECSGASETFEELVAELEALRPGVVVVKLLCEPETALDRIRSRDPDRLPVAGASWPHEIDRTEMRLRRVPADLTVDTTRVGERELALTVEEFLNTRVEASDPLVLPTPSTVTFSQLALHERCPLAHDYRYVREAPELFLSAKTLLGELVHRALARLYAERERGEGLSLGDLLDGFDRSLATLPSGTDGRSLLAWLEEQGRELLSFHYRQSYQYDRLRTLETEHHFSLRLGSGLRIAGRIDRLAVTEADVPVVIDFKTGSSRESYLSDVPDLLQLEVYGMAVLVQQSIGAVEVRRHAVRSAREERSGVTVTDLPRIRRSLRRWLRKVERSRYPRVKPGKICEWCAFSPRCPERAGPPGAGLMLSTDD